MNSNTRICRIACHNLLKILIFRFHPMSDSKLKFNVDPVANVGSDTQLEGAQPKFQVLRQP
jgi:hypothetical protein